MLTPSGQGPILMIPFNLHSLLLSSATPGVRASAYEYLADTYIQSITLLPKNKKTKTKQTNKKTTLTLGRFSLYDLYPDLALGNEVAWHI